jgi:hypothetical protein
MINNIGSLNRIVGYIYIITVFWWQQNRGNFGTILELN